MDRTLIVFDLDTKTLEKHYHNASWNNGYKDIQRVLKRHGFKNIQGTVYLSEPGIREAHGTLALQEVALRYPWFTKAAGNVQFYALAADFNASFIVEGVERARAAFQAQLEHLKQELLQAGLPAEKVEDILSKRTLTLEQLNNQPGLLPES